MVLVWTEIWMIVAKHRYQIWYEACFGERVERWMKIALSGIAGVALIACAIGALRGPVIVPEARLSCVRLSGVAATGVEALAARIVDAHCYGTGYGQVTAVLMSTGITLFVDACAISGCVTVLTTARPLDVVDEHVCWRAQCRVPSEVVTRGCVAVHDNAEGAEARR